MKRKELLFKIKDAFQRDDDLEEGMMLHEIEEWDSLAALSIIALFKQLFSVVITYADIQKLKTIKDIMNLVQDKLEN